MSGPWSVRSLPRTSPVCRGPVRQSGHGVGERFGQSPPLSQQCLPADSCCPEHVAKRGALESHHALHCAEQRLPVLYTEPLDSRARGALERDWPVDVGRGQDLHQPLRGAAGHLSDQAAEELGDREPRHRADGLAEARAAGCCCDPVGRFLELECVGPARAYPDPAQIPAAGCADGDVPRVGSELVQLLRSAARRAPIGQPAAVCRAARVPSQPPADTVVWGFCLRPDTSGSTAGPRCAHSVCPGW